MSKEQQSKLNFFSVYSGSADNVIKNVVLGKVDAGAVFVTSLEMEPKEIRDQLHPIIVTQKVAPHPLCAHPRIPQSVQDTVRKAVFALSVTQEGTGLLKEIRMPSPVAADYAKDYKSLEEIDVRGLSVWGE